MSQGTATTDAIVLRVAGDSGDGIQLMGSRFAASTAYSGSDFTTFQDFPAEIRAPVGTTFGVSAYQVNLGSGPITTPGDAPDILVAFNPAALKVSLPLLKKGALIVLNSGSFSERNLAKAGYDHDPRDSDALASHRLIEIDITQRNLEAVTSFGLTRASAGRCKNFWALGLLLWMFSHDLDVIESYISHKFRKKEHLVKANLAALRAGNAYAETAELSATPQQFSTAPAEFAPGVYRGAAGSEVLAFGLAAAAQLADRPLLFCSYPITPASSLLHNLARMPELGVGVFQAEDEIAAACAAIGASYGGAIGVTSSSGPGMALKTEAIGLAVSAEVPLVVVNSQRGGPATGLPTKTEQSDLYQAVFGRNGDTPVPVLAPCSPSDCFGIAIDAVRIALRHMTPVIILTDGYLVNAAEAWSLPEMSEFEPIEINQPPDSESGISSESLPFQRDPESLGRPWVVPGTPGLMHRLGGLESDYETGHLSYNPQNHQRMSQMRADKVASVAKFIPPQGMELGPAEGDLVVVGWGSTYGAIYQAVRKLRNRGARVSHVQIRHLNPFPENLGSILSQFDQVLVPEMNMGQLSTLIRDRLELKLQSLNNVSGQPFRVVDLVDAIQTRLDAGNQPSAMTAEQRASL
jgi:2-oxoglutarate ferredoxin oxidoreductase subunit alpha